MKNKFGRRARLLGASAGAALGLLAFGPAKAQHPTTFVRSVAPLDASVQVVGKADPQAKVTFQVVMNLRDYQALEDGNRAGRILTAAQLRERHMPTEQDYQRVLTWLQNHGMTVEKTNANRMAITASGDVAQVSRLLGVHFSHVKAEGKDYVSADTQVRMPTELAGSVLAVNGLQPHLHAYTPSTATPASLTSPAFYPQSFLLAYKAPLDIALRDGGSQSTTAVVIDTFPLTEDLEKYWKVLGIKQDISNITMIQAVPGTLRPPGGEESLDVETISGIAQHSKVRVYASTTLSFVNIDTTFQALLDDMFNGVPIHQVSISLGACEPAIAPAQVQSDNAFFAVMSALGASVFVSTGDSGSYECGKHFGNLPSFFATSPNVTAVGGTTLHLTGKGEVKSETSWTGSGGGFSTVFSQPAYQTQAGIISPMRTIPDISADANPNTGELVRLNHGYYQIGGTSLSAPIVAGLMALVNSQRAAQGKGPMGLLNQRIYQYHDTPMFRDITVGDNKGYPATVGYDLVTGMGTPDMSHLLPFLVAQP